MAKICVHVLKFLAYLNIKMLKVEVIMRYFIIYPYHVEKAKENCSILLPRSIRQFTVYRYQKRKENKGTTIVYML